MELSEFGKKTIECSSDRKIFRDDEKVLTELLNNMDERVNKIEELNKVSKDTVFKTATEKCISEMRNYKTLYRIAFTQTCIESLLI